MTLCPASWILLCLGALSGSLWPSIGRCHDPVPQAYRSVATAYGIPPTLLYAIAMAESGVGETQAGRSRPWPWTLNVAGRGVIYPSRRSAWEALNRFLDAGERSIDVGLMQVNWRFHRDKLGDPWQALDPYHNLRVGATILRQCFQRRRDWWAGVGCYHAPRDRRRAQRYRSRVIDHWQRLAADG